MLHDARIRAAFKTVSRANFLPDLDPDEVYADRAVIIKRDPAGTAIATVQPAHDDGADAQSADAEARHERAGDRRWIGI
ncbi:MAG: hypothetical protein HND48_26855 [Chloroflexi bacterium]|nr:hypothetical protein [Chloroflexota bacterium]